MTMRNRTRKNGGNAIDWKAVHSSFRSVLEGDRVGDRLSTLTMPLLLVLVGLLLVGLEINETAIGFFVAALAALLWTRRRMAKCERQSPYAVTGLLTRKQPPPGKGKGLHTLTVKVRTAHYINARGKGDDCPARIGINKIPVSRAIADGLKPQTVVSLICLPGGEARGYIQEGKLIIPPGDAPPQIPN